MWHPIKLWWNAHACTNKHTLKHASLYRMLLCKHTHCLSLSLCPPEISLFVVMTTVAVQPEDKWEWMAVWWEWMTAAGFSFTECLIFERGKEIRGKCVQLLKNDFKSSKTLNFSKY